MSDQQTFESSNPQDKRRSPRWVPDNHTDYAVISVVNEKKRQKIITPIIIGLIINESSAGACIVTKSNAPLNDEANTFQIKVGDLDPVPFRLAWVKNIDGEISKYGCEYILPKNTPIKKQHNT